MLQRNAFRQGFAGFGTKRALIGPPQQASQRSALVDPASTANQSRRELESTRRNAPSAPWDTAASSSTIRDSKQHEHLSHALQIGERLFFEENQRDPETENRVQKKKIWDIVQSELETNDDGVVIYQQDYPLMSTAGAIKAPTLKGAMVS